MTIEMYKDGTYLAKNPTWDAEDSPWKAKHVFRIMKENNINPKTVCEVGCGAGEILRQLQANISDECEFWGYEISPQAFEICKGKVNEKLHFKLADIRDENVFFDLILLIDVIEHVEDYYNFLRDIKQKGGYKILHIPLDISVQSVLRGGPLIRTRESVGHIHIFTKEIILQVLRDLDYEVINWFYTAPTIDLPAKSIKSFIARIPRRILFAMNKNMAVRIMGGYSMMIVTK
jgi:cyclopropane fatty-acyl-phospholipid synthase-like methyltransferase